MSQIDKATINLSLLRSYTESVKMPLKAIGKGLQGGEREFESLDLKVGDEKRLAGFQSPSIDRGECQWLENFDNCSC